MLVWKQIIYLLPSPRSLTPHSEMFRFFSSHNCFMLLAASPTWSNMTKKTSVLLDLSNYLCELEISLLFLSNSQKEFAFEGSDIKLRLLSELVSPGKFIFLFSDVSEPEI